MAASVLPATAFAGSDGGYEVDVKIGYYNCAVDRGSEYNDALIKVTGTADGEEDVYNYKEMARKSHEVQGTFPIECDEDVGVPDTNVGIEIQVKADKNAKNVEWKACRIDEDTDRTNGSAAV